jgi:hypothetical protein
MREHWSALAVVPAPAALMALVWYLTGPAN